jgi:K+-transporting ATPase KdpF subunit
MMNFEDIVGLIVAALLVVYLLYALLHPEEL